MRISLIISEENKALERDISRLIDVNAFYMRYYPGHGETPKERRRMFQELSKMKAEIEKADLIIYARSYGVFSSEGWKLLHSFFSKPVIISTEEIAKRVREKRVFLVSPYNQYRHDYEVKWLREFSKVVGSVALGRTGGDAISSTPPHLVESSVKIGHENPEAEIVYVACTILSTLPYLDRLKGGKPVITASSVLIEGVKWDG
ncbi:MULTISPECIES: maleate cis-trans isomerase [Metallosphaera]|uniref:Maleate cis-trans isomerase n=3 Tax=Metallosphaera TaxID=41980 RepID=A4YG64_METS5|nr:MULTISPECIES: maleate cis-trans isomerase [Metallosphaera]ABP95416.1 hypothetical protein Msed_1256 [Metallosphaera sedula DSM 5348]AIM27401.1 hypothetical protein HA72_1256 [Metallosphaera sedula]AKV74277.1 maleate cis-trans isomerase [Metallosphaera sedula]AKV76516.1 maleate cis-trans isomerase [Metallosphaera sedula]AKV78768.1 maleate cis-trans isomerase [Metallosphaera sedula]